MDITVSELRAFCATTGRGFMVDGRGHLHVSGHQGITPLAQIYHGALCEMVSNHLGISAAVANFSAPGYEHLAAVLHRAFNQAAHGKGKERHANGEPFDRQVIQDMARRFGVGALLGQAFKKSEESQRLPTDRAVNELLGSIVYLAAAVMALEAKAKEAPPHANDNLEATMTAAAVKGLSENAARSCITGNGMCASCKRGPEA